MSVRVRRLVVSGLAVAAAVAVPVAALASGPGSPSAKPSPVASKSAAVASKSAAAASKSAAAASEPRIDPSAAAASKSAAAGSGTRVDPSMTGPVAVAALADRLGVSHNAAQRALEQIGALGRRGGVVAVGRGGPPGWRGPVECGVRGDRPWSRGEPSPAGGSAGRGEAGRGQQVSRFGRAVPEHND
jgi:hypothetical protein